MVRGSVQKYESLNGTAPTTSSQLIKAKPKKKFRGKLSHTSPIMSSSVAFYKSKSILNNRPMLNNTPAKLKRKFKGKLRHTSPLTPNKLTKYYGIKPSPLKFEDNIPRFKDTRNDSIDIRPDSAVTEDQKRKVLQEPNIRLDENRINENCENCHPVTKKTEPCVPYSPSTALSQLNLSTPKRISKVRKRIISEDQVLKNNSIKVNSKILNDNYNSTNFQTKLTEFYPVRRSVRKTEKTVLEEKRRTIEQAILSNKEDGLEVRIFEGKGRGVVAVRKFYKGEFVVEYAGEFITMEEAQKRESKYSQDENIGCYMYYFKYRNNQCCIDATAETGRLGRLLNHSRNGNLNTKTVEVRGIPRLVLIAKEDIETGSELTYDYGDRSKLSLQYYPWLAQ